MKNIGLRGILAIFASMLFGTSLSAHAGGAIGTPPKMDCSPLAPQKIPSEEIKANAELQINAISKKIFGGGLDTSISYKKQDLLANIPGADKVLIAQLSAYLLCESAKSKSEENLAAVSTFANQVLPALGYGNKKDRVIEILPLPTNGEIALQDQETKVFDGGRISIISIVGFNGKKPKALVYLTYVQPNGQEVFLDNKDDGIALGKTRKYALPTKRFSLTFKEYFDGTQTAIFAVKKI